MTNNSISRGTNDVSQANYAGGALDAGIEQQPKQPNKFLSVLKGIGGVAAGFIPGVGGMLGGIINGGGGPNFGSMQTMIQQQERSSMRMLSIQQQVANQGQEFTAVSNLLKARHDSEMSAVSNFKS